MKNPLHGPLALRLSVAALVACSSLSANRAQAEEPAKSQPKVIYSKFAPVSGSLVICGGGRLPGPVMDSFVKLAGGNRARLVIIPTASSIADSDALESRMDFWRNQEVADVSVLHTRSRKTADEADFVKPLAKASGVWFMGGGQGRVTDAYLGTEVQKMVHAVLARGGVVGGTSAGAAIMSPVMIRRGSSKEAEVGEGLGFLPGTVIDQHFIKRNRQERLLGVLNSHPGMVGLGIDEGTALIVQGRKMSVLGESSVIACMPSIANGPPNVQILKSGDEVDLFNLCQSAVERTQVIASGAK